ncbi:hypothetical protein A3D77_00980 [Candidatus Gottesmanbacteria bacterium RIFCSPHIGHO2_02_FULL_39_11]|uniref:Type II toxin-antitoxin system RelE/ParE family toxin n=1 Tax=Candidatus Gottesmanbacteria bacterium RIFCSPHIGHO2_02_FULL_39_11 TaxID=1798382 RepID=A0A1F5ZNI4_9BACT|nr:MAG: hypothetical protein A3D77_00980 [Candidatus Gottesmanbacteria bacterium RIFCSPHIGHO2_02_FULL_39_11]
MPQVVIVTEEKVQAFLNQLDRIRRARVDRYYTLLENYGWSLPSKYLKKISAEIWELRPGDIRIFMRKKENKAYAVHAIIKKTQKTSLRDLQTAIQRGKEIK